MKQTKEKLFLDLWEQWRKHFGLPAIEIKKDLRYHCNGCIETWYKSDEEHKKGYTRLIYNTRKIAQWTRALLICIVFHELAHYKNKLPYNTVEEKIKSEYKAERFAITMMKRYYPKEVKEVIEYVKNKILNNKKWKKKWPIHTQAYLKIKEYIT